jgi:mono/diheme cytochrome c family protein
MRRRVLRVLAIAAGLLLGLLAGACALVYLRSELILRQTYPVPHIAIAVPTDSASIDEGRRLAQLMGCSGMCHGRAGRGAVMFDDPAVARLVAPNLAQAAHRYDDATLEALIRHGVRPDGRSLLVMPAESFQALTDADLGRIIAYLRSLPPDTGKALPQPQYHFLGRLGLALGKFHPTTQLVAKSPVPPPSDDPRAEHGRYVARIVCAHCHGTDLHGKDQSKGWAAPPYPTDWYKASEVSSEQFIFWIVSEGTLKQDGTKSGMPAWKQNGVSDQDRWALVTYIKHLTGR